MHVSPSSTHTPPAPPASFTPVAAGPARRDRVLAGLIGKDHGLGAIAAYLGLSENAVLERVVAVGLPTPANRPMRLGAGPKAWSLLEIRRLIDLWCRNLPGTRIAGLLGRAAGGVYAKARRLGLFRRPRSALLRGPLPLFPASDEPRTPEPGPPPGGKRKRRGVEWSVEMEDEVADRWFALQSPGGIGRDMGLSLPTVASKAHRLQLPCRYGLVLHDDHRPERKAEAAHLFKGWTRRVCTIRKRPFWTRQSGIRFSDEVRRQAAWRTLQASPH